MKIIDSKRGLRDFIQELGKVTDISELFISNDDLVFILDNSGRVLLTWSLCESSNMFDDNHIAFCELPKEKQYDIYSVISSYRLSHVLRGLRITVKYYHGNDVYSCDSCGRELELYMVQSFDRYNNVPLCVACAMTTKSPDFSYHLQSVHYELITLVVELHGVDEVLRYSVKVDKRVGCTSALAMKAVLEHLIDTKRQVRSIEEDCILFDPTEDERVSIQVAGSYVEDSLKNSFAYSNLEGKDYKIIGYPLQDNTHLLEGDK